MSRILRGVCAHGRRIEKSTNELRLFFRVVVICSAKVPAASLSAHLFSCLLPFSLTSDIVPKEKPSAPTTYTVWARDKRFTLSLSQIQFESPNLFTQVFLEHDFKEKEERVLRTDRHPFLMEIIIDHLSGYNVLPINEAALPPTMNALNVLKNLAKDAEYFGLNDLAGTASRLADEKKRSLLPLTQSHKRDHVKKVVPAKRSLIAAIKR